MREGQHASDPGTGPDLRHGFGAALGHLLEDAAAGEDQLLLDGMRQDTPPMVMTS